MQFERRFRTFARPFEGRAVDDTGREYHLCVKPQIRGAPDLNIALFAEWCGYALARHLAVPVPNRYLVRITPEFLASAPGELGDVLPGLAFGSEWQEKSTPATFFTPPPAEVSNPESIAGVCVLDTLQQNGDRHCDNVLFVPVANGVRAQYRLCYIDNGWLPLIGDLFHDHRPFKARVPDDEALRTLVQAEKEFNPFFFSAEALNVRQLTAELLEAPLAEWKVSRVRLLRTAARARHRSVRLSSLFAGAFTLFPRLREPERGDAP